jgi:hypothetical protein
MITSLMFTTRGSTRWSILCTALVGSILSLGPTALLSAQTVTICRPNGGENWAVGEIHAIHWNWTDPIDSVDIEYSTDGGSTWNLVLSRVANDGDALWTVPNTPGATCRIKVTSTVDPDVYDASDASFAIARPEITVARPNGGEAWIAGEKRAIDWNWTGAISSVDIDYSTDGGSTWNVVLASVANDGDALWTVPNTPSATCRLRITSTEDDSCLDLSNQDFSIIRPTISVLRPDGGETYYAGRQAPIHWTTSGSFVDARLEFSTDAGGSWAVITSSTANDGDYCWSVPEGLSKTTCRVRVTDAADSGTYDASAANFTISNTLPLDSMHLFSPRSGDVFLVGNSYFICWTRAGSNNSVKLEYATDGGSNWSVITPSTANDGEYEWQVPSIPSTVCRIRISSTANPGVHNESDLFTIERQWILTSSPTAGDAWLVGRNHFITWKWGGQFSNAKLQYSTDRGSTWRTVNGNTANSGAYEWQAPEPPSSNGQVKIINTANSEVVGLTDFFEIAHQTIGLTSPLSGDTWQAGRYYYITWNWDGRFDNTRLYYSTDRGSTWRTVSGSTANTGYYEWQVANTGSTNCEIKAVNAANGAVYAVSGVFTILPKVGVAECGSDPSSQNLAVKPNPSRGRTLLRYFLTGDADVNLVVLDASGRQVRTLVGAAVPAGAHSVTWDRRDESGRLLPSGVYFFRMVAGGFRTVNKLIVQ